MKSRPGCESYSLTDSNCPLISTKGDNGLRFGTGPQGRPAWTKTFRFHSGLPGGPGAGRARGAPPAGPAADGPLGARPVCGVRVAPFALMAGGTPMAAFANVLSQLTQ